MVDVGPATAGREREQVWDEDQGRDTWVEKTKKKMENEVVAPGWDLFRGVTLGSQPREPPDTGILAIHRHGNFISNLFTETTLGTVQFQ